MKRFIFVSFLFLAWGYWELSGGAEFVPETRPGPEMVTRAGSGTDGGLAIGDDGWANMFADAAEAAGASFITAAAGPSDAVLPTVAEAEAAPEIAPDTAELQPAVAQIPADEAEAAETPDFTFESAAAALNAQTGTEAVPGSDGAAPDLREIAASRVNMRQGPGTSYAVIDTLDGGTELEVLEEDPTGWARVRATDSGLEGWMAARLLEPVEG